MPQGVVVLGFDAGGREVALTAVKEAIEQAGEPRADRRALRHRRLSGCRGEHVPRRRRAGRALGHPRLRHGIGLSIAANKMPGILAARCGDVYSVEKAWRYAGANVLTLGSELTRPAIASTLVGTWMAHEFDSERSIPKVARVRALDAARSGG